MSQVLLPALALVAGSAARFVTDYSAQIPLQHEVSCKNTPTSRGCWGDYGLNTNYYTTFPDTGKTVEVWLSAEEHDCSPDGYQRSSCMTFNGTIPGPAVIADWGDDLIIHVTNNLKDNGTSVHWHGVRQLNSVEYDGVPGVTQCPIPPGETLTYKYKVTQYGSSWYHSHFSLQYSEGLFGPLIFNGPATSNYDEDLGALFLQDWSHGPVFNAWSNKERYDITHPLSTILINGTNTFDCSTVDSSDEANCFGNGTKFQTAFEAGKKYRLRLVNVATDSQFQFSIDGHSLKVIANDFVAIEPYDTDSVVINAGQRYDIIVEANANPGDYWLRADWVSSCFGVANENPTSGTGIVRYDVASTSDPTSKSTVTPRTACMDEPLENLVPYLKLDVSNITRTTVEDLNYQLTNTAVYQWTVNSSSFVINWDEPTLQGIMNGVSDFPATYNIVDVDRISTTATEWAVLVVENTASSLFVNIAHPLHLHGHDFWVLAQETRTKWDGTMASFNTINPPRRDVAVLPPGGYLAVAFKLDNPGVWLVHCHIAWHASQGLALEFLESKESLKMASEDRAVFDDMCEAWNNWSADMPWNQEDSGV